MIGYLANIEEVTLENSNYRKMLFSGRNCQLIAMCLKPGEEMGREVHAKSDQIFYFEDGKGKVVVEDEEYQVRPGVVILIPQHRLYRNFLI